MTEAQKELDDAYEHYRQEEKQIVTCKRSCRHCCMNEILFSEIAQVDFQNLERIIQKGSFQSSEFENAVLETANTLLSLHQAICQTKENTNE